MATITQKGLGIGSSWHYINMDTVVFCLATSLHPRGFAAYRALHERCIPSGRPLCCAGQNNQAVGGSIIVKSALAEALHGYQTVEQARFPNPANVAVWKNIPKQAHLVAFAEASWAGVRE